MPDIQNSLNAKTATNTARRFLVVAKPGAGKTTQFLTLPGKKFAYLFDPNAMSSLEGYDVDCLEFLPRDLQLGLTSLSKEGNKKADQIKRTNKTAGAELYRAWEEDYEKRLQDRFFDQYDNIMFDSFTTLSDMVMDGILAVNGRAGQWPQIDDYGPQMLALTKIVRSLTSLGKTIYMTAHCQLKQDETTKRIVNEPLMTGQLKSKLPILFSDMLTLSVESDGKGNVAYVAQTRPDRYNEICRCSLRDVNFKEDITIDWKRNPEGQGLGKLFKDKLRASKAVEGADGQNRSI